VRILVLFDVPEAPPSDHDYAKYLRSPDWEDEQDVVSTLTKLGYEVVVRGVFDDLTLLITQIREIAPNLIFNMCEIYGKSRRNEGNLVGLFEMLGIPHTGAGALTLRLAQDKALTKKVLTYHSIRTPRFEISDRRKPIKRLPSDFALPVLCKPLDREGSEGISKASLIKSVDDLPARLEFLHEKMGADAIIEEYIPGRELYVGVMGRRQLKVLPPVELHFRNAQTEGERFATFRAKWDQDYRQKKGIESRPARNLDDSVRKQLEVMSKKIYQTFGFDSYARIDYRLKASGELMFLEVNPNPAIGRNDEFAKAAVADGMEYSELLTKIVNLGINKSNV
jgi:D-alanine-D-alanine ligase